MDRDVLVVAVHPDDETLGCGGTLLRHAAEGDRIHWIIGTEMASDLFPGSRIEKRDDEIRAVSSAYGFASVHRLGFPTTRLAEVPDGDLVRAFSKVYQDVRPHTVYLPFHGDVHSDHRKAFSAAYTCVKSFRYPFVRRVLMMEVLSETEFAPALPSEAFIPNVFRNIDQYLERKLEILSLFESEVSDPPFPRSFRTVQALAAYRGAAAGCLSAEAFMLLKDVH